MINHPADDDGRRHAETRNKLLTPNELAEILQIPVATLYSWRYQRKGPVAVRVGRHLRYRCDEVDEWIAHSERSQGRGR